VRNTWWTSDTHFGHAMLVERGHRPFVSVEEMDAKMIEAWNAYVKDNDDVWHLGDFNFRGPHDTKHYISQLHGRINIIWGNHDDKYARRHPELFASVQDIKYLRMYGERIYMSHYAHRVWRSSHHGSWHLYGHSHAGLPDMNRSMDVGVDARSFKPISFEEVGAYMLTQPVTKHHPELP
jgi:calcineurin-like phosphoesterase family protein